jgi:excisionase family DNA binding protein
VTDPNSEQPSQDEEEESSSSLGLDSSSLTQETYLTVRQLARYIHLNEKKIYALIKEGRVPATKASGKWLFPRRLIDEWLVESAHGGALTDRLIVAGSDDPLLAAAVGALSEQLDGSALVSYLPTGSRAGLALLAQRLANASAIHWGPAEAANRQHRTLVSQFPGYSDWMLLKLYRRQQGIMLRRGMSEGFTLEELLQPDIRWIFRQAGAGSQHALESHLHSRLIDARTLNVVSIEPTERQAASLLARQRADCAPGVAAAATEFGLDFIPLWWEAFDLVLPKAILFRQLFQQLLDIFRAPRLQESASALGGYDLSELGRHRGS